MPPLRIFVFARKRRCPMVFGAMRKAWAIRAASRPKTVCSMSGVCIAGSIAGWAETKDRPPAGRRIPGPHARWSGAYILDCFHSPCEPSPHGFRRQRPDFHCADGCSRASRGPFESSVNGREFEDDESCQLLLRIGVGAILHAPLSFLDAHRRSCFGQFQCVSADVDLGLHERLVVSAPGAEMRIAIVVLAHGKLFR